MKRIAKYIWICCLALAAGLGNIHAQQVDIYQVYTAPYDSSYDDLFNDQNIVEDSVTNIVCLLQPNQEKVDFLFFSNHFYIVFYDGGTADEIFIMGYFNKVEDYVTQCNISQLDLNAFDKDKIINAVLHYHNAQ